MNSISFFARAIFHTLMVTPVVFGLLATTVSRADIPGIINYQGFVTVDNSIFNGNGHFKFALVDTAGTTTYWSNDGSSASGSEPTLSVPLAVSDSGFALGLGDMALTNMTIPIPSSIFVNGEVFLRVWFSDDGVNPFEHLEPDQRIVAVGYALHAASADFATSVPASSVTANEIADDAVTTDKIANGTIMESNIAPGGINSLDSPDGSREDVLIVNDNGWIGIGTVNPDSQFHLVKGALDTTFSTGFEEGSNGPFTTDGDVDWQLDTNNQYSGLQSAKAGEISDNQSTNLELTISMPVGGGELSFARRVSSESVWDYLELAINEVPVRTWSGDVPWGTVGPYPLSAGPQTIRWSYVKDGIISDLEDTAWLDDIVIKDFGAYAPQARFEGVGVLFEGGNGTIPQEGAGTRMMWYPKKAGLRAGQVDGAQWDDVNIGKNSTAMGINTTARGVASTALGDSTAANGHTSTAMGLETIANSYVETVVGAYNVVYSGDPVTFKGSDRLFSVGNGTADHMRSDAMVVLKNGNVGISQSVPYEKLHVDGNVRVENEIHLKRNRGFIHWGTTNKFGTEYFDFNSGSGVFDAGMMIESGFGGSAGIYLDSELVSIWSSGDEDLLRVYDEDDFSAGPEFVIDGDGNVKVEGQIESTEGGIKFPDGSVQLHAAKKADGPCFDNFNRYVACGNGTITDTVTGLIWLRDADCFGTLSWKDANEMAANLADGQCGLTDGSSPGDWRIPTHDEWKATVQRAVALGCTVSGIDNPPSLTNFLGDLCFDTEIEEGFFTGVQSVFYWSSSTYDSDPKRAWGMPLQHGSGNRVDYKTDSDQNHAWPVRSSR